MHIYGEAVVDPTEIKLITSYVVPARGGVECVGAVLWGETFSEFHLYCNGTYVGGGRTSAACPTLQLDYKACPIELSGNDVLLAMGEQGSSQPKILKAVLLVNLL